jgi:amidohydrolase
MRDLSHPTVPSRAFYDQLAVETEKRRQANPTATALDPHCGASTQLREELKAHIEALAPQIVALSQDIHAHPEVGYQEFYAADAVAKLLQAHGIEVERASFGMETSLRAQIGGEAASPSAAAAGAPDAGDNPDAPAPAAGAVVAADGDRSEKQPTIAILCEYDALPGVGHGCGHNVMCANSVGAFLALAELEKSHPGALGGRVILQTTPAEECDTAKEILAQRGMLEGVDAAIQTHSYAYDLVDQAWLGVRRMRVVFHGVSAHAASAPFMGRNALDAVTLAQVGMGLLRQHMLPSDRMHAVVTDGGLVPNVVPERAEMSVIVRSLDSATLRDLVARVEDVFRGAALATGCGMEILTGETTNEMPVRANGPLSQAWVRAQNAAGRTVLPRGVITEVIAAGTDFGNVSQRVPGIHPLIKIAPEGTALHTHEFATAAGSPQGDRAAVDGAWGLASVALDYLSDPQLRQAVRADFEASGGVVDVASFWD